MSDLQAAYEAVAKQLAAAYLGVPISAEQVVDTVLATLANGERLYRISEYRMIPCADCYGRGWNYTHLTKSGKRPCETCKGTGSVEPEGRRVGGGVAQ